MTATIRLEFEKKEDGLHTTMYSSVDSDIPIENAAAMFYREKIDELLKAGGRKISEEEFDKKPEGWK